LVTCMMVGLLLWATSEHRDKTVRENAVFRWRIVYHRERKVVNESDPRVRANAYGGQARRGRRATTEGCPYNHHQSRGA